MGSVICALSDLLCLHYRHLVSYQLINTLHSFAVWDTKGRF
jgi:hypothetical protein